MFKSPPPILARFYVDGENQSVVVVVMVKDWLSMPEHYVMSHPYFGLRCPSRGPSPYYRILLYHTELIIGVLDIAEDHFLDLRMTLDMNCVFCQTVEVGPPKSVYARLSRPRFQVQGSFSVWCLSMTQTTAKP